MKFLIVFFLVFFQTAIVRIYAQGEIYDFGNGTYAAAVKTEVFKYYAARQESQNWCWAACIQMILNYQGLPDADQCAIVKKAFNIDLCDDRPADCNSIQIGANGWSINQRSVSALVDLTPSVYELIDQLAKKSPVIIGLNMPGQNIGHAYVLTAIYFQYDQNLNKVPYLVILRDPWPTNNSRKELEWNDFISRINCITYVTLN